MIGHDVLRQRVHCPSRHRGCGHERVEQCRLQVVEVLAEHLQRRISHAGTKNLFLSPHPLDARRCPQRTQQWSVPSKDSARRKEYCHNIQYLPRGFPLGKHKGRESIRQLNHHKAGDCYIEVPSCNMHHQSNQNIPNVKTGGCESHEHSTNTIPWTAAASNTNEHYVTLL